MIKIAHIDTGTEYRGGQRQVDYLISNLADYDVCQYLLCPDKSPLVKKCEPYIKKHVDTGQSNLMRLLGRTEIKRYIEEYKIDILHAHDSHAHSMAALISPRSVNGQIVVTRRSSGKIKFGSRTKYRGHKINYIAISEHVKENLVSGGVPDDKVSVIPSMLDLSRYLGLMDEHTPLSGETVKIISAGAFDKSKGFIDVIKAVNQIREKYTGIKYYLYGSGLQKTRYGDYIRKYKLEKTVVMPGWVDDSLEYFTGADLFVTSSYSEGLNSSLLEAMAARIPIIATDIPPHRENIIEGQTGLLYTPGNTDQLAEKLTWCLENKKQALSFAEKAFEKAEIYDCKKITEDIYKLYCRIITDK